MKKSLDPFFFLFFLEMREKTISLYCPFKYAVHVGRIHGYRRRGEPLIGGRVRENVVTGGDPGAFSWP
jgi:hypothetical protein